MHLDRQHYYSLEGLPEKLHTGLSKGVDLARQIAYSKGNHLICRISRVVGCYFILLLTLPFTLMGTLVHRIFREKSIKLFQTRIRTMGKIFYDYKKGDSRLMTDTQDLITTLIKTQAGRRMPV
ncbi:MAG: hypothetical protein HWD61_08315 [Parachlamydiaceae bacterium]|nr:MAG: hypothetical protein HWD61_08315 [Parachlamydiaceae bacterium]